MRCGWAAGIAFAALSLSVHLVTAQEIPRANTGSILTVEPDRLISDTKYGQAVQAQMDATAAMLLAENRKIDSDLEAEEVSLTAKRESLPVADFRALAEAFDAKVEGIRAVQDAKGKALAQQRDAERQKVLKASVPILAQLMAEKGAVAILDKASVFLAFDSTDVTDEAIAKLDTTLPLPQPIVPPKAPVPSDAASP